MDLSIYLPASFQQDKLDLWWRTKYPERAKLSDDNMFEHNIGALFEYDITGYPPYSRYFADDNGVPAAFDCLG